MAQLHLLLEGKSPTAPDESRVRAWSRAGVLSLLVHVLLLGIVVSLPPSVFKPMEAPRVEVDLRRQSIPLVAPRFELTQKEPAKGKVMPRVDLEGLLARPNPQVRATPPGNPAPPARVGQTPTPTPKPQVNVAAPPQIDAPVAKQTTQAPEGLGNTLANLKPPTPQIQPEEKPKLAFENVGSSGRGVEGQQGTSLAKLPAPPRVSVEEAVRAAGRNPGAGLTVGDAPETGDIGGMNPIAPPSPGRSGSSLQLLSDPLGVDFKPYLIKVLAAVRRNWFAVIPESARYGRRGRVTIQFAISREGKVPKLVIASPSGVEAFDRAAVAGISMSNPFPPLPPDFRGDQIRLQFNFSYNTQ